MVRRRTYTKEYKESAVELYHSNSSIKTIQEVAGELGINPENLRRWLSESKEVATSSLRAFPGHGNPRDEELARLKKENADLRETVEILKKATAIFAVKKPQ
jgi:transposase-like protein